MQRKLCCGPHTLSAKEEERSLSAYSKPRGHLHGLPQELNMWPLDLGLLRPGAPRSLEGERRAKECQVGRLAEGGACVSVEQISPGT